MSKHNPESKSEPVVIVVDECYAALLTDAPAPPMDAKTRRRVRRLARRALRSAPVEINVRRSVPNLGHTITLLPAARDAAARDGLVVGKPAVPEHAWSIRTHIGFWPTPVVDDTDGEGQERP